MFVRLLEKKNLAHSMPTLRLCDPTEGGVSPQGWLDPTWWSPAPAGLDPTMGGVSPQGWLD